ncbi:inhibitor of KinA [Algibacter lectus]|uniref:5-oxoprolinase subunit PxpB n=1 Tax=Algibacter lectus TaxID=221126 RepID=UPI0008E372B2|nr:5-oxoprolinase subunit PxpB [Algibacter lectus]SFB85658.1 inhibitor of KinA [Algibacter lectus]
MAFKLCYKSLGLHAVLVEWPAEIREDVLQDVLILKTKIENYHVKEIIQVNSSYNSLLVFYENIGISLEERIAIIDKIYSSKNNAIYVASQLWKIPVCYDEAFGLDLDAVSIEKKVSKNDIIKQHCGVIYTVYFIGFLPGFLYLGGLDKLLQMPRKSTPRLQVAKGAVAIGGNQTGVYPNESPGGWNIIGNSPLNFFDVSKEKPCFAKAGDRVQFYSVSLKTYNNIKTLVEAGVYELESEEVND